MNNEIKEMNFSEMLFNRDERLLDYITNLQEENKVLKELNVCVGCKNNLSLQERIDKAIELLNRHDIDTGDIYYKYNNRFVKSELKERIKELLEEVE